MAQWRRSSLDGLSACPLLARLLACLPACPSACLPACPPACLPAHLPAPLPAQALLETTGIVVVPGSGFRQKEDTWHFRTTFLPPESDMDDVIAQMATFHADFMAKYK